MKKFKDFRVTVFMIIMIPALLALSIYSKVVWHSQMRFVLALIMTITIALICLAGYNLHLYSDIIMIYTWKYVALLPEISSPGIPSFHKPDSNYFHPDLPASHLYVPP